MRICREMLYDRLHAAFSQIALAMPKTGTLRTRARYERNCQLMQDI